MVSHLFPGEMRINRFILTVRLTSDSYPVWLLAPSLHYIIIKLSKFSNKNYYFIVFILAILYSIIPLDL